MMSALSGCLTILIDPEIVPSSSLDSHQDLAAGETALHKIATPGIPIHGAGMVLDRGAPHMFVVLPLGAPNENVDALADFLREQPAIGNAFPQRYETGPPEDF